MNLRRFFPVLPLVEALARRAFRVSFFLATVCALCLTFIAGCKPRQPQTLTLLIWNDYISPEIIHQFERSRGCTIKCIYYTSNEELMKLLGSEKGLRADIAVPSSYCLVEMKEAGLIQPLSTNLLHNQGEISKTFVETYKLHDYEKLGVPYFFAPTVIASRGPKTPLEVQPSAFMTTISWDLLPEEEGKPFRGVSLLDDKRETIAAALFAVGASNPNSYTQAQWDQAKALLEKYIEGGAEIDGKNYPYRLMAGEINLAHAYPSDVIPLTTEGGLVVSLPAAGTVLTCDYLTVLSGSPSPNLAHEFIDFLCRPDIAAQNMRWVQALSPIEGAYLEPKATGKPQGPDHPMFTEFGPRNLWGGRIKPPPVVLRELTATQEAEQDAAWKALTLSAK